MNAFRLPKLIALLPLACALALGTLLRAEDPPATPPPSDKKPEAVQPAPATPAPAAAPAVAQPAEKAAAPAPADAAEVADQMAEKARADAERIAEQARADAEKIADEARRKAEETAAQARANAEKIAADARASVAAASEAAAQAEQQAAADAKSVRRHIKARSSNEGDRVIIMDDNVVEDGTTVPHDAVAVMGNLTVNGEVMHDAVAVMGNNTINGTVHHDVVAVMGNIDLGPKAIVHGNLVSIGGEIHRDPGAVVDGRTQVQAIGGKFDVQQFSDWWTHGLKLGRPLAFGAHLAWLWIITAFSIAFYALLGLVFPGKIRSCGDKLTQEPGMAILAGLLGVLALPVLFVLLCITIIGIPVALLMLPVATLLIAMFGKAAIYGLVGRRLSGDRLHPALAVILGALLFVLLYLLPFVGLMLSLVVWFLGFGCAVLAIFSKSPQAMTPVAPAPVTAAPSAPVPPVAAAGFAAAPVVAATVPVVEAAAPAAEPPVVTTPVAEPPPVTPAPAPAPAAPVPLTADTLPRAGFWIRVAAAFLDFMLVMFTLLVLLKGLLHTELDGPGLIFLGLAAYHAAMWKTKGTTIGGIICGLKVVRLDDKPIDWGVAVVRALTGFLSFIMGGLGFIWVAFDDGKQSWHDKVAGTTIVRVPKGTSLL